MKKILIIIAALVFYINVSAQNKTIKGKIIDSQTKEALMGVNVYQADSQNGTVTDITGNFELIVPQNSQIIITYVGYEPQRYQAEELPSLIELQSKPDQLDKVVVTAGGERQQRKSVPISITQISAKELEETKPITLEEVLNKTPGVLMVDLGNEQHSMSIRQPISYKSVFLYLEDGLPIRMTGVFNHNALIEINHSALKKIEIIRGPYSAIYGSGAIGGAINFITKEPTATPEYNAYGMLNNVGYRKLGANASNSFGKTGIYVAADYSG